MSFRRGPTLVAVTALFFTACSGSGSDTTTTFIPAVIPQPTTTTTAPARPFVPSDPVTFLDFGESLADLAGVIAVHGPTGLSLVAPSGEVLAEFASGSEVSQPTWSRGGEALVATVDDHATGTDFVLVIDAATFESSRVEAARDYLFYSWNADRSRIAALGPSGDRMALDILHADGRMASPAVAVGDSVFLAWQPEGNGLALHLDETLVWFPDATNPATPLTVSTPGMLFQAPAWVPGTQSVVAVAGGSLRRFDLESGHVTDLGPVLGMTEINVHPSGARAAIAHSAAPADPSSAVVEEVDLLMGTRRAVSDAPGFWLEWSPSGDRLLYATVGEGIAQWNVWSDGTNQALDLWIPTERFLRSYLRFAPQYTESPRLWAPDDSAIVFGAQIGPDPGVVVLPLDGRGRVEFAGADMGFWGAASRPVG